MTGHAELQKVLEGCTCQPTSTIIRAGMALDRLQALLAAADKVCAWAEHDRGCHGPRATGSCTCGLQEARGAYQALKETQDG